MLAYRAYAKVITDLENDNGRLNCKMYKLLNEK